MPIPLFKSLLAVSISISVLSIQSTQAVQAAEDPFAPYLASVPPIVQTISEVNSGSGAAAITTKKFTFASRGAVNTVYGILVQPQAAGVYPAMLVLHGGGGDAETVAGIAQLFAQRGYVALAVDLPGIAGTTNTPYTTGPWKSRALGEGPRFEVATGPQTSMLVDAEVAGLEGFNLLRSQANVKKDAMGITGYSWGGYSTTMLSGLLGDKVKAAYAVFGCGFYDKGSFWKTIIADLSAADRNTWLTYLDAGRRAPGMKAAYFLEGETNDTYFWPEAVTATLDAVPGVKNHAWGPNLNHHQMDAGATMQRLWFDYYLKGTGSPFAEVSVNKIEAQKDGSRKIGFDVKLPAGVTVDSARLYYSEVKTDWQSRVWIPIAAKVEAGSGPAGYGATLPAELSGKQYDYYALVTDARTVATASAMYNSAATTVSVGRTVGRGAPALAGDWDGNGKNPSRVSDIRGRLFRRTARALLTWAHGY
jgi:dienelactone hydrolase